MTDALAKVHKKLANSKAQEKVVAHDAVEAYKLFEDCKDQKIAFLELAFLEGMEETWRRVARDFLELDLNFLDEEE